MRTFSSGATRDSDDTKIDPEGFLSPLAIEAFCNYMHEHRKQADGGLRASDNWQKGIPRDAYMKSIWRHFLEVWKLHRGQRVTGFDDEQRAKVAALSALLFNVQGYLHEVLIGRDAGQKTDQADAWTRIMEDGEKILQVLV